MGQKLCLKLSSKCSWICKSQKALFFKSVSNLHFFSSFLDICLKDTMSLADSLYNLQLIQEFCQEYLNQCCHFSLEDMLYAASSIKVKIQQINKNASNIHRTILLMICLVFLWSAAVWLLWWHGMQNTNFSRMKSHLLLAIMFS